MQFDKFYNYLYLADSATNNFYLKNVSDFILQFECVTRINKILCILVYSLLASFIDSVEDFVQN